MAHKITINNHLGILETVRYDAKIGGRLGRLRARLDRTFWHAQRTSSHC